MSRLLEKVSRLKKSTSSPMRRSVLKSSQISNQPLSASSLSTSSTTAATKSSIKTATTATIIFQLSEKQKELEALKKLYSALQQKYKLSEDALVQEKVHLTAQLSIAHRQLGNISKERERLQQDTKTSKILHQRKAQVVEKRLQAQTAEAMKKLRHQVVELQSKQSDELEEIQSKWNEARHQLSFEREIVCTQREKIVSLLQQIEKNEETIQNERQEYEKKCNSLVDIQNEQCASLATLFDKFQQCRQQIVNEKKINKQIIVERDAALSTLKVKEDELRKAQLAKNYILSTNDEIKNHVQEEINELNMQVKEEIQLRIFAQKQMDDEIEKYNNLSKEHLIQTNISKQLKKDVSNLMHEMKKNEKKYNDDIQSLKYQHQAVLDEMKENHKIEMNLLNESHQEDRDCLINSNIEALDALRNEMNVSYRNENELILKEMSNEYDLKLEIAMEHQFKQLNQRHIDEMNSLKNEMVEERELLFQHVKDNASIENNQNKDMIKKELLSKQQMNEEINLKNALENQSNELKLTFLNHIGTIEKKHLNEVNDIKKKLLIKQNENTQLNKDIKAIKKKNDQEKEQLTKEYELKYQDAFKEVQNAMNLATNKNRIKDEEYHLNKVKYEEKMKKEILLIKENTANILSSKLKKMSTLMNEQHKNDIVQIQKSYEKDVNQLKINHASQMDKIKEEYFEKTKNIQKEQRDIDEMQETINALNETLIEEKEKRKEEIDHLTNQHRNEMDEQLKSIKKENKMLSSELKELQAINNDIQINNLDKLKKLENEWSKSMNREEDMNEQLDKCHNKIHTLTLLMNSKEDEYNKNMKLKDILMEEYTHEQKLKKLSYEEDIKKMINKHTSSIETLNMYIEEINQRHTHAVETMKKQHGHAMETSATILLDSFKQSHMDEMVHLKNQLKDQCNKEIKLTDDMKQFKLETENTLKELKKTHIDEMTHLKNQLKDQCNKEIELLSDMKKIKLSATNTLDELKKKHMDEIIHLNDQLKDQRNKEIEVTNDMKQLKMETANTLKELKKKHMDEMDNMEKKRIDSIDSSKLILEETIVPLQKKLNELTEINKNYSKEMLTLKILQDKTIETHQKQKKRLENSHRSVLEVMSKQMNDSTIKYDAMEKKYMSSIAKLQVDICTSNNKHREEINALEAHYSKLMKDASDRIHQATETTVTSTLDMEASIRESILESHQETVDELEEEIQTQRKRANDADERLIVLQNELEHMKNRSSSSDSSNNVHQFRKDLTIAENYLTELKNCLNAQQEEDRVLNMTVKAVGNHNTKEKINFIEKLQKDRRELKKKNRHLTAEVAKIKIEHAKSGFKEFQLEKKQISIAKLRKSPCKVFSPSHVKIKSPMFASNKENSAVNSPRSATFDCSLRVSQLNSSRKSLV